MPKLKIQLGLVLFLLTGLFMDNAFAQSNAISVSGEVLEGKTKTAIPFVNVILKSAKDSTFIAGTVTDENGRFTITNVAPSEYILETKFIGYIDFNMALFVGSSSPFLQIPRIE